MPHLLAIVFCALILFALVVFVVLEYRRSRQGPRLASKEFLRDTEQLRKNLSRSVVR